MAPSCHVTLWFQTSDSCQQTAASFLWCLLKTQLQMFWPVLSHYGVKSVKSVGSALISGRLPFGSAISSICAANSSHGPWRLCEASRQWSRKDCIVVWGPKQLLVSDQQTSLAQLAERRKRDKLPTTLCHLWWLCQSAEASLSWARLKTWRGEAFKQGSQEKESLRAWRQAAETILLFRTEAFPSLFLFLFFRTPELAFSFTKSFVSGPSASQFSFRAEMAFNPPFLQFACEISQKNLATYSIASFHILVAWESIKSQWVQLVLPISV